ncbi:18.1 kDa class I heat shock protein-like isoform X1 [Iris pallida]|uniref:18.1 kDa class I heat shock protein-like isoform X1 n=1 Tax=Iris pallida TaxID=29817 RepID=A0AAX6DGV6_IRIPA|nr:18.1 kDa class I heat shock protein-like isoform X1 [Iris pallida]
MSLAPFGFGSRILDPVSSSDLWDLRFPVDSSLPIRFADLRSPVIFDSFVTSALSSSVPRSSIAGETSAFANTRIDWKETPEAHVFKADLPGIKKVEVEEGRVLQISGERSKEQEEKNDKWHRVERSSGKFLRRFRLPENAKVDQVKASMENGVLTVTVPKEVVKKPEVKSIDISG